jgi:tRNA A-37 threonylcarbamoyl transferase component Bud32
MAGASLTVADWNRLNRLLEQGLELEASTRLDWLDMLDASDQHLRTVLAQLLTQSEATGFTDATNPPTAVANMAAQALAAMRREQPGDRIGPWQLERLLAEGGMGAVWVAQRADGMLKRTAALKLPRAEWVDHGLSERISRERAILARLQHPHIAVLYDAGLGAEGRPYLALEYVDGQPIDAYGKGRDLDAMLRLFVQVIRAVAYAHGQLVIHRDLKPANVLVTADGLPKLLDFGISKLIEGDSASVDATALTRLAGRPLTLAYAAPEQVLGLPITVAADVYALGVMLFELLTESRLYRAQEPRALEAELLRGDLRKPSDAAADQQRAKALHGDLDAIILTALKRQPAERYQSATALADDLEAYLAGLPVKAQPDSRAYRLRKFISRNTLPVAAGSAVVVALVIGAAVALWQATEARDQAQRATALNTFVLGLIRTADPNASAQTKAADVAMLNAIEERIDKEFNGSPDQLLHLRVTVGEAYKNRGEMMAARRVFQRAVDDGAPHLPPDDLTLLTARVRAADYHLIVSNEASDQLDRAIEVLRRKGAPGAELLLDALLARTVLGVLFGIPSYVPHERRLEPIREAADVAIRHFGEGSRQHLRAARWLAIANEVAMNPDEGQRVRESVLAQARQRTDGSATSIDYTILFADRATGECEAGRTAEAQSFLRDAIDKVRAAHGPASPWLEDLTIRLGECSDDNWAYMDAYEIAAARERPPSPTLMRLAEWAYNAALGARDVVLAERYYQAAVANALAIPDEALRDRLTMNLRVGRVCQLGQRGDAEAAERLAATLIAGIDADYARVGRLAPSEGPFRVCLGEALRQLGRFDEAAQTARTFRERCRKSGHPGCEGRALVVEALAELDAGHLDAARTAIEARLSISREWENDARFRIAYARVLLADGRAAEAIEPMRLSYGNWLSMSPDSPFAAESLYWFGRAYLATGDKRGRWMVAQAKRELAKSPVATHRALAAGPDSQL